ncbi:MAG: hypothetical protein N2440_01025 [Actinobacteria bacterium]|nr:hypothetical protein [Actinomycetota bacterium]
MPIYTDKNVDRYILFSEAQKENALVVKETRQISRLKVINKSNKNVLITQDEIITGGLEKRLAKKAVLIAANSGVEIPVYYPRKDWLIDFNTYNDINSDDLSFFEIDKPNKKHISESSEKLVKYRKSSVKSKNLHQSKGNKEENAEIHNMSEENDPDCVQQKSQVYYNKSFNFDFPDWYREIFDQIKRKIKPRRGQTGIAFYNSGILWHLRYLIPDSKFKIYLRTALNSFIPNLLIEQPPYYEGITKNDFFDKIREAKIEKSESLGENFTIRAGFSYTASGLIYKDSIIYFALDRYYIYY